MTATQLQVTRKRHFIFGAQALACLFLSSKCRLKPAPQSYVYTANQGLLLRSIYFIYFYLKSFYWQYKKLFFE